MSTTGDNTTKIILTGSKNFKIWMVRLAAALGREQVLDVVTGADVRPSARPTTTIATTTAATEGDWKSRDYRAQGIILDWIDDRLAIRLISENLVPFEPEVTSKKMFDRLVQLHREEEVGASVGVAALAFHMFTKLINLRWDGASDVEKHISRFSKINSKLISLAKPIDGFFLAFLLLRSLPTTHSWETFKLSVLNSLPLEGDLAFSTIKSRIVAEAMRLKGVDSYMRTHPESALGAVRKKKGTRRKDK